MFIDNSQKGSLLRVKIKNSQLENTKSRKRIIKSNNNTKSKLKINTKRNND